MKIQKFDGGLSTRLAPQFLQLNQSRVNVNIDNSVGVLAPVKDKTAQTQVVDKYFTYFNEESRFVSATVPTDYVNFQNFLYSTDGVNRPRKKRGEVDQLLGIEKPALAAIISTTTIGKIESASVISSTEKIGPIGPFQNPNNPPPDEFGDLPSIQLNYMVFVENNGSLSVGYNVVAEPSFTGFRPRYRGTKLADEGAFTPDFDVSSIDVKNNHMLIGQFSGSLSPGSKIQVYRHYNNQWKLVGSVTEQQFNSLTSVRIQDDVYDISDRITLVKSAITSFNGTYQYVYTYYNSLDGTESAPSPLSEELVVKDGVISVSIPSSSNDPQVTHKRLYRVGGNIGVFTLVTELAANVVSYTDSLTDTNIDGRTLQSENYFEAPAGLKHLTESYAMLFGAVGNELRFTPIGVPNAWPPEFSLNFEAPITGIGAVANGLLVMTKNKVHIVTGTGPFSLSPQSLRGDQGCISHKSVQQVEKGMLVWASSDGLCVSSGNNVQSLTKYLLGDLKFEPTSSGVNKEVYYLHNNDGTIFVWDYRFEPVFKQLDLDVEYIQEADSEMYGFKDGVLFKLLSSDTNKEFKYESPMFVEGAFTERKMYNKFNIYSTGLIILKIYIDSVLVLTKQFTESGPKEFKVPQETQSGYSLHFEIEGTGTVNELEYEVGRRKNG